MVGEEEEQMLDYFLKIEDLKKVKRYLEYDKVFSESVADHSFFVCLLGVELMGRLDLKLNFEKVVKMSLYHDLCELGLDKDYDAFLCSNSKDMKVAKKKYEQATMRKLSSDYDRDDLLELREEYEAQQTSEARFVKALDRLETLIHILNVDNVKLKNEEFTAKYCDEVIANFPELKPFYGEVKEKLKQRFEKDGLEWKKEYE